MLDGYRRVLTRPGAALFSATATLGRLPLSMAGLGIVLLVSERSGSYGYAGSISAVYVLAAAPFAPAHGRWADRYGQAPVLVVSGLAYSLGMTSLLLVIDADAGGPWPYLCAVLAGMATPQTGSMARARWSAMLPDKGRLNTAFAIEAVLDEVVFIVGPVLVTVLTLHVADRSGLVAATVAAVVGCLLLAAQHRTAPPISRHHTGPRPPIGWTALGPVVMASVGIGTLFGSTEVIVVAFTDEQGQSGAAGVVLAIWAGGSLIAGVGVGAVAGPSDPLRRLRITLLALSLLFIPLLFLPNTLLLAIGMFLAGLMISPTMIAATNLVERHVPPSRLTEGLAWTSTGLSIGVAPGAAVAGWIIDHHGASAGFLVPLAAGLAASVVAWVFHPPPIPASRLNQAP